MTSDPTTPPARVTPIQAEDIPALIERLKLAAARSSEIQREMAEAKSLRQGDCEPPRKDLYMWPTPEQTLEGRAAAVLAALSEREQAVREALERAHSAMRWVYRNGMKPDYDRPEHVSVAFSEAFEVSRAGIALVPAPKAEDHPVAGELVRCQHEPYQGACAHCGIPFRYGQPYYGEAAIAHPAPDALAEMLAAIDAWAEDNTPEREQAILDARSLLATEGR